MLGIRHEDKSAWESRVPLVPADVSTLIGDHGLDIHVETSPRRSFADEDFARAGATLVRSVSECPIVLGVKEIPVDLIEADCAYVFFSHTIKGQAANMAMLRRLMERRCTLIDYELIVDDAGRRQVFFGRHAGLAGMIDALWLLGRRWQTEGIETPFLEIAQASTYGNADTAKSAVAALGVRIRRDGLPVACRPLVCGFAGYGHVSRGAQEIFDLLGCEAVEPEALADIPSAAPGCFKTVFHESHMVVRKDSTAPFALDEYYRHPDRYGSRFAAHLPYLTILVNGIYWEAKYPRLVTLDNLRHLFAGGAQPRLRLIADITCDIDGAMACTVRATDPGKPCFVFEPKTGQTVDGVAGNGPVVLAVDTLPCELPVDASVDFSRALTPLVPGLDAADLRAPLEDSGLPPELARATIVHRGALTEAYRYLEGFL